MRQILFNLFRDLKNNDQNRILFFRGGKRYEKSYAEFSDDVDRALFRLDHLARSGGDLRVALIGPVSYDWIVCDMACIKGGFFTIAIPETISAEEMNTLAANTEASLILMDSSLAGKYTFNDIRTYYFECRGEETNDFRSVPEYNNSETASVNRILEAFGIVFSSGTSGKTKYITRTFPTIFEQHQRVPFVKRVLGYWQNRSSVWSGKDNRFIIFMPFSHSQQRDFFRTALLRKIDIILSDQHNCLKHIIIEKPNMMVSVPLIYELMADRIREKLSKFGPIQRFFFNIFNLCRINTLSNRIWIKRIFSALLFNNIRKIYGGRADYFVTGSAPISIDTLKVFYSVGVKILQAYGQTEVGRLSMSTPRHFRIGSVGKPAGEVKIAPDSEILVWYNDWVYAANKDILTINEDQYIQTGDLGYIDKDGYLFVTGRKDEIIVLDNGKKIFPEKIEGLLRAADLVEEACVFIKEGYRLHAVIKGRPQCKRADILDHIKSINQKLPLHEQIRSFNIVGEKFSVENGFLTPTFKKKRHSIKAAYEKDAAIPVGV